MKRTRTNQRRGTGDRTRTDEERQRSGSDEPSRPVDALHGAVGNQAVSELDEPETVQPKLTVSQPGDAAEREAERVADAVMRMDDPEPVATTTDGSASADRVQRMCSRCQARYQQGKPLNCEECEQELA